MVDGETEVTEVSDAETPVEASGDTVIEVAAAVDAEAAPEGTEEATTEA